MLGVPLHLGVLGLHQEGDQRQRAEVGEDQHQGLVAVGAAGPASFGVDTLVVDRLPRIGDCWRLRYHSLALHNGIKSNHLPYLPFPPTWPTYIPKDMLGLWFEFYAQVMEVNHWTSTEFTRGEWDEGAKRWVATLKMEDGSDRVLRPRHIVFANGVSSYPLIPEIPGLDTFKGDVIHSEGFDSGAPYAGKNAIVIGTGSSANDIALDLHSFG